jgi:microsomal dipeptidase-like Zn-dependent dipeptidase
MRRALESLVVVLAVLTFNACARMPDRLLTGTVHKPPYEPDPSAANVHQSLTVVDLHADQLLWNRDLLERASRGHVDLPRLQEANVALQVFGAVTGVPFPLKMEGNRDRGDAIAKLAKWQDWPEETHDSRLQRALYQAEKLADRIDASGGALVWIKDLGDLETLLAVRARGEPVIGAMLGLEGAHALEGDAANTDVLFAAGFRMIGLVHLFDNEMAGSSHGEEEYGLTDEGREVVRRALSAGMIIDLAHASEQAIDDTLAMVDRPVVASHGGVRGTCDTARNLADRHIRAIASTGGVIGIGVYKYATCGKKLEDTVEAMRYVADLVGVEHVALGSDFDGTKTMIDVTGLVMLTQALLDGGFTEEEIGAIMGGNALRVFRRTLLSYAAPPA